MIGEDYMKTYYENGTIEWVKSKELDGTFISSTEEMITEEAVANSSAKMLPENAPKEPKASAEKSTFSVLSYVTIASGQCTIDAITKTSSCFPRLMLSPSFTVLRLKSFLGKN